MTAHQLAEILLRGPDLPVHLEVPSGDYWRTVYAPEVSKTGLKLVGPSRNRFVIMDGTDDETGIREAIVLSGK